MSWHAELPDARSSEITHWMAAAKAFARGENLTIAATTMDPSQILSQEQD